MIGVEVAASLCVVVPTQDPIMSPTTSRNRRSVVYALDFDGVLVDSAGETAQSGLRAAKILWPSASWIPNNHGMTEKENDDDDNSDDNNTMKTLLERFREVRPVLYVGWESIILVKLILDPSQQEEGSPQLSNDDILEKFHSELKDKVMQQSGFGEEDYNKAMKEARDSWIAQKNGQDWIQAHGFFEGACQAVRDYLQNHGNDDIYVITTKAKGFAERLLEQQGLYGKENLLKASNIFGLGSDPKVKVLQSILEERSDDTFGVMVEDNIATLDEIMASPIHDKVLPVVAAWGYNTSEQLEAAKDQNYVLLSDSDSSSLATVLDNEEVTKRQSK